MLMVQKVLKREIGFSTKFVLFGSVRYALEPKRHEKCLLVENDFFLKFLLDRSK